MEATNYQTSTPAVDTGFDIANLQTTNTTTTTTPVVESTPAIDFNITDLPALKTTPAVETTGFDFTQVQETPVIAPTPVVDTGFDLSSLTKQLRCQPLIIVNIKQQIFLKFLLQPHLLMIFLNILLNKFLFQSLFNK
jgi:hypothetical protein